MAGLQGSLGCWAIQPRILATHLAFPFCLTAASGSAIASWILSLIFCLISAMALMVVANAIEPVCG